MTAMSDKRAFGPVAGEFIATAFLLIAWVALDHATIADIACCPYVGMAPQGEVSLDPYPAVRAWIARVKALPGYVPMPGLD